jgi:hypothetical protein
MSKWIPARVPESTSPKETKNLKLETKEFRGENLL